jgi:hypothetical protein
VHEQLSVGTCSLTILTCAHDTQQMAVWQLKLQGLQGLTDDEKEEAEVLIPQRYLTTEERNHFLRGTDAEAAKRVKRLLGKSCWLLDGAANADEG